MPLQGTEATQCGSGGGTAGGGGQSLWRKIHTTASLQQQSAALLAPPSRSLATHSAQAAVCRAVWGVATQANRAQRMHPGLPQAGTPHLSALPWNPLTSTITSLRTSGQHRLSMWLGQASRGRAGGSGAEWDCQERGRGCRAG
jgi:hypothetical protein